MDTNPITLPCSLARAGKYVLFETDHIQGQKRQHNNNLNRCDATDAVCSISLDGVESTETLIQQEWFLSLEIMGPSQRKRSCYIE